MQTFLDMGYECLRFLASCVDILSLFYSLWIFAVCIIFLRKLLKGVF